jgi:hypothetical protein
MLGALMSGCGTTTAENAVLADRPLKGSQARLKIYREGIVGAALPARVAIDGREVASIGVGGSTVLDVPTGSRKIVVDSWSHPNAYTLALAAKPGMLYTLEISIRSEAMVAGMFGLVGQMVEASANENGGNFQIRVVDAKPLKR